MTASQAEALQKAALTQARTFLEGLNVPTNLIDKMFQLASTEVYWLSGSEVEVQLGRRPPWYEQFLIARCGFKKSLEADYFATNNPSLLKQLIEVDRCGAHLARPDAEAFITKEINYPGK